MDCAHRPDDRARPDGRVHYLPVSGRRHQHDERVAAELRAALRRHYHRPPPRPVTAAHLLELELHAVRRSTRGAPVPVWAACGLALALSLVMTAVVHVDRTDLTATNELVQMGPATDDGTSGQDHHKPRQTYTAVVRALLPPAPATPAGRATNALATPTASASPADPATPSGFAGADPTTADPGEPAPTNNLAGTQPDEPPPTDNLADTQPSDTPAEPAPTDRPAEIGPPAHASTNGRSAHAGRSAEPGPPAHASTNGRPAHPGHRAESDPQDGRGRPAEPPGRR